MKRPICVILAVFAVVWFSGCAIFSEDTDSFSEPVIEPVEEICDKHQSNPTADATPRVSAELSQEGEKMTIDQPPLLTERLGKRSFDELDCDQLVLVVSEGSSAQIFCYDCTDGQWRLNGQISYLDGHVGKNGISGNHTEGDGTTPTGLFALGFAFGNEPDPGTQLEYREVTDDIYWVSDPESERYNRWVSGTDGFDADKAEHLCAYRSSYAYSVVIEYNMPDAVPYAGSAIFFHCGDEPTAGCVSVCESSMVDILRWLKPGAKILIT